MPHSSQTSPFLPRYGLQPFRGFLLEKSWKTGDFLWGGEVKFLAKNKGKGEVFGGGSEGGKVEF